MASPNAFSYYRHISGFKAPLNPRARVPVYVNATNTAHALNVADVLTLFDIKGREAAYVRSPLIIRSSKFTLRFIKFTDLPALLAKCEFDMRNAKAALSQFVNANGRLIEPEESEVVSDSETPPPRKRQSSPPENDGTTKRHCDDGASALAAEVRAAVAEMRALVETAVANIGPNAVLSYMQTDAFKEAVEDKKDEAVEQLKAELRPQIYEQLKRDEDKRVWYEELKESLERDARDAAARAVSEVMARQMVVEMEQ